MFRAGIVADSQVRGGGAPPIAIGANVFSSTSSITEPAHNSGDILMMWHGLDTDIVPALAPGYTSLGTGVDDGGLSATGARLSYRIGSGSSNTISGTGGFKGIVVIENAQIGPRVTVDGRAPQATFGSVTPTVNGGITLRFLSVTSAADVAASMGGWTSMWSFNAPQFQSWHNPTIGAVSGVAVPLANITISSFFARSFVTSTIIVYPA